jgi:hypothetical protein
MKQTFGILSLIAVLCSTAVMSEAREMAGPTGALDSTITAHHLNRLMFSQDGLQRRVGHRLHRLRRHGRKRHLRHLHRRARYRLVRYKGRYYIIRRR